MTKMIKLGVASAVTHAKFLRGTNPDGSLIQGPDGLFYKAQTQSNPALPPVPAAQ
ncbi:MAG: hypothetical protein WDO56_11510 [Gammaproteobacteria bacterium]